jgi:hypothetical protein
MDKKEISPGNNDIEPLHYLQVVVHRFHSQSCLSNIRVLIDVINSVPLLSIQVFILKIHVYEIGIMI